MLTVWVLVSRRDGYGRKPAPVIAHHSAEVVLDWRCPSPRRSSRAPGVAIQLALYGLVMELPTSVPSTNATFATPLSSVAEALNDTLELVRNWLALAGLVSVSRTAADRLQ